jgi:hypothetical protein
MIVVCRLDESNGASTTYLCNGSMSPSTYSECGDINLFVYEGPDWEPYTTHLAHVPGWMAAACSNFMH